MESATSEFLDDAGWDRRVQHSPGDALTRAQLLLDDASPSETERARLLRVVARAQFELGRLDVASDTMRAAVRVARTIDDDDVRHAVLMTSAVVLAEAGDVGAALANLALLEPECDGPVLARVRLQQAYVLHHAGRLPEALVALDHSDRLFAVGGTEEDRFRVHLNRGLVLLQHGDLDAAETDIRAAADLAHRLGMTAAEGQCHANAGVLYGRGRRIVESLRAFEHAEALLAEVGRPYRVVNGLEIDRAEVQMHSGLVLDAVDSARRAL
ncbi:MAG TPA: hypothetical protein VK917_08000, partial [Ilumatobacter sp.]|nr:hypothetical protein [Ilumatobacter sp.]